MHTVVIIQPIALFLYSSTIVCATGFTNDPHDDAVDVKSERSPNEMIRLSVTESN